MSAPCGELPKPQVAPPGGLPDAHVRFALGGWPGEPGGAVDGNRTRIASLEGWCSAVELLPHTADHTADKIMSAKVKMIAATAMPIRIIFSARSMLPLGAW